MPEKDNLMKDIIGDLGLKDEDELKTEEEQEEDDELEEDEVETEENDDELEEEDDDNFDGEEDTDEDEDLEDEEEVIYEEEEFTPKHKHSKEEKARFAFEKQRKELKEKEQKLKELDEIAQTYGYTDHESMLEKLREDALNKQAKEKGIDPTIYKQMQEQSRELARLKSEREQEIKANQVKQFLSSVDTFSSKYQLTADEKSALIDQLDDAGFTVDTLVRIKNPEKLFSGYMSDKVLERYRQNLIKNESKKKSLEEKKFTNPKSGNEKADIDALLDGLFSKKSTKY